MLYILLKIHDLTDEYTIDLGWGRYDNNHIPEHRFIEKGISIEQALENLSLSQEVLVGLGGIRHPEEKCVPWYYLGEANGLYTIDENGIEGYIPITPIEEAMKNLEESLVDMTTILDEYIIPTFIKVIERYK